MLGFLHRWVVTNTTWKALSSELFLCHDFWGNLRIASFHQCKNTEIMSARFVRCQRCIDYTHKCPYQVEKFCLYFVLKKLHGMYWAGKAPTEAVDNRMERLEHRGKEFEEIMVHFTLDRDKNPKIIYMVKMNVLSIHNASCKFTWPISRFPCE